MDRQGSDQGKIVWRRKEGGERSVGGVSSSKERDEEIQCLAI
jgi:hypothetical protein